MEDINIIELDFSFLNDIEAEITNFNLEIDFNELDYI